MRNRNPGRKKKSWSCYAAAVSLFATWLETLTPEMLNEMVTVADGSGTKSRFEQLLGVKEHEMHHRAQLMLIERQLGIIPT